MSYIFDLGNVIVDTGFSRILGAWSDLTHILLVTPKQHFIMGKAFHQHKRGEISDEDFAAIMCHEVNMSLSHEQFARDWQATSVALHLEVVTIMHKLRTQGHRVVMLSNINRFHATFWSDEYPEVRVTVDRTYPSQEMGLRRPEVEIYL